MNNVKLHLVFYTEDTTIFRMVITRPRIPVNTQEVIDVMWSIIETKGITYKGNKLARIRSIYLQYPDKTEYLYSR
jgi:Protein of unknown function (DUF2922)